MPVLAAGVYAVEYTTRRFSMCALCFRSLDQFQFRRRKTVEKAGLIQSDKTFLKVLVDCHDAPYVPR
jgi:hypothetical protein